jgi:hypothetical protein
MVAHTCYQLLGRQRQEFEATWGKVSGEILSQKNPPKPKKEQGCAYNSSSIAFA